jgi:leucyl/phenylalanyl-tRNA--protein transferase
MFMTIDLDLLLKAYASGIFPMADARDDPDTFWVEPKARAVIPLDNFQMSRSLRKTIRSDRFRVTTDCAFADVIAICATEAADRRETWINADIEAAFNQLHKLGHGHSVECWQVDVESGEEQLVGGLYGLAIGGAFCGESMFSRTRDASKVALAWLVARLKVGGFSLLDCQFMTDHLASLGAIEISQEDYVENLKKVSGYAPPSVSAIRSPIASSDGLFGAGAGRAAGAAGAEGAGTAFAGAASFGALDVLLARLDEDVRGAVGSTAPAGASSSPGKLIAQLLTQTS